MGSEKHTDNTYAGFISYSQKDKAWAKRIHKALEAYRLPTALPSSSMVSKKLGRFFRDDDELASASSLGDALDRAINNSKALIVICSPSAAQSKWVDAEIRRFKTRGKTAKVFAVIVSGRPDTENLNEQCFPQSLKVRVTNTGELTNIPDEPLAPDVSKDSFARLITRLAAGLSDLEFDALWQREKRRTRKRRLMLGTGMVALIAMASFGILRVNAEKNKQRFALELQQTQESITLAADAQLAMNEGRVVDALRHIVAALPDNLDIPNRPVVPQALSALERLLAENPSRGVLARFDKGVAAIHELDQQRLVIQLNDGQIKIINREDGDILQEHYNSSAEIIWLPELRAFMEMSLRQEDGDSGEQRDLVSVYDPAQDGITRSFTNENDEWWIKPTISPNGQYVFATALSDTSENNLAIFEAKVGDAYPVISPSYTYNFTPINNEYIQKSVFIDDARLALAWGDNRQGIAIWDFQTSQPQVLSNPQQSSPCDSSLAIDEDRQDQISLSLDKTTIVKVQPVGKDDWCVLSWSSTSLEELPPKLEKNVRRSVIFMLSQNIMAITDYYYSSVASVIRPRSEHIYTIKGCAPNSYMPNERPGRVYGLGQFEINQNRWTVNLAEKVSLCTNGNTILVNDGPDFMARTVLRGHEDAITSLYYDAPARTLFSGSMDGTVREWALGVYPHLLSNPASVVVGEKNVLLADGEAGEKVTFQLYTADGNAKAKSIDYLRMRSRPEDESYNFDLKFQMFMNADRLIVVEGMDCVLGGGCSYQDNFRVTLINTDDGKTLRVIDNVKFPFSKFNTSPQLSDLFQMSLNGTVLIQHRDSQTLQILDLKTGQFEDDLHLPKQDIYVDSAFAHGRHWLLTEPANPSFLSKKAYKLYQVMDDGTMKLIHENPADMGSLKQSPDGAKLIVQYQTRDYPTTELEMFAIQYDEVITPITLPKIERRGIAQTIHFPITEQFKSKFIVFFPSEFQNTPNSEPPFLFDTLTGEGIQFTNTTTDPGLGWKPIEDKQGRALMYHTSSYPNVLRIESHDPNQPLCPDLDNTHAFKTVISPDGDLLAIDNQKTVTVYDLTTCAAVRSHSFRTSSTFSGTNGMYFADAKHLWIVDGQDTNIMSFNQKPEDLLLLAQELVRRNEVTQPSVSSP